MKTLQNIPVKNTVVAIIMLFLGLTFPARAELTLNVQGVFSSPDTAIKQGDSATFSVTVSVEGDLPAGEHITDDDYEIYWSINRAPDYDCIYSLGPTTAQSIHYTFDEGERYQILCSVSYYYKLDGDDDYTQLWVEAEGYKDVVKVTGISLRASGDAKTIGDTWIKDDWDIATAPSGYRDLVICPDCIIDTGLHTHTATCGTSHADFTYRGITIDTHWDAWTPGADGTYDPDTFDYGVDLQGTDGIVDCQTTVDTSQGSGPITGGDSDVTFTGDGTHSFAVNVDTIALCGGSGGGGGDPITSTVKPPARGNPGPFGDTSRRPVPAFAEAAETLLITNSLSASLGVAYPILKDIGDHYFALTASSYVVFSPRDQQLTWQIPATWSTDEDGQEGAGTQIIADLHMDGGGVGYYHHNAATPTKVVHPQASGTLTWHQVQGAPAPAIVYDQDGLQRHLKGRVYIEGDPSSGGILWALASESPPTEVSASVDKKGQYSGLCSFSANGEFFPTPSSSTNKTEDIIASKFCNMTYEP